MSGGGDGDGGGGAGGAGGGGGAGVRVTSYQSHEEGDHRSIPPVFFDSDLMLNQQLNHTDLPRLHHALSVSGHQRRAGRAFLHHGSAVTQMEEGEEGEGGEEGGGGELWSVAGRESTFPEDWSGPARRRMAEAGFYKVASREGRVACAWCPVQFQRWRRGEDPWERHRSLSALCPYVRLRKTMPNRKFRHSTTSLDILGGQ